MILDLQKASLLKRASAYLLDIILLLVMTLFRQLLEPKFIGRFIGVHPMVALAAVFVGYRLWGVFGMFAAPVILYILKSKAASKCENIASKRGDE